MDIVNNVAFGYNSIEEAFPPADPGIAPFGSRVIVQLRTPKSKTKGGIILNSDVRETELYNTQIGKVAAIGPLAFHSRNTGNPWPEGDWAKPGDYVRVPKHGGDRWVVKTGDGEDDFAIFVVFEDLYLVGSVSGDPRAIRAFL